MAEQECVYDEHYGEILMRANENLMFKALDWQSFRREAAKDILCAMLSASNTLCATGRIGEREASNAIMLADELIKQLKEEKK